MIKFVFFVLIVVLLGSFVAEFSSVTNLFSVFNTYVLTPLTSFVSFLKSFFDIALSDYYLTTVISVLIIAFIFRFILDWIIGR